MTGTTDIEIFNFNSHHLPQPYESTITADDRYITFGHDNLFPKFILDLYNDSPIHSAIINSKTTYILGDGLKYSNGADLDFKVNSSDNIKEFTLKLTKDYLIFNAFAVEVIYNKLGKVIEYHHVPMHCIRMNKTKTQFWVNEDWTLNRRFIKYSAYSPASTDYNSKIFYFDGYNPSTTRVYTLPEYYGSLKSIATDIAIRSFNLNNIKNHFSPSSIITFYNGGNQTDDIRKKTVDKIKKSYTGEYGEKFILDFQNQQGKSADVKPLSSGDWADTYNAVADKVASDIMIGHSVTNPMLFGVKTEGQLGGATELETSYEIFKATYVRTKRDELESALNTLFASNEQVSGKVAFGDKPLFNTKLSDVMKEKVLTIDEIRAEAGLPALPEGKGARLISETTQPTQLQIVQPHQEEVKKKTSRKLTDEDYEQIKDLGTAFEDFEILGEADDEQVFRFGLTDDVSKWVIENDIKGLTLPELVDVLKKEAGLKVSENRLQDILKQLNESGVAKVVIDDDKKIQVTPAKTGVVPDTDGVFVMYKYEKRPSVDGPDLLNTSRGFCVKLINNNRLYTRQDIQSMGRLFGYDVFKYAGGFYYNPDKDETTPYCRHQWKAYSVKRKTQ